MVSSLRGHDGSQAVAPACGGEELEQQSEMSGIIPATESSATEENSSSSKRGSLGDDLVLQDRGMVKQVRAIATGVPPTAKGSTNPSSSPNLGPVKTPSASDRLFTSQKGALGGTDT